MRIVLLFLSIFLLAGCSTKEPTLGAFTDISQVTTGIIESEISTIQNDYFSINGKYKQYFKSDTIEGTTYPFNVEIHEYLDPDGNAGYVINVEAQVKDDFYRKSINLGPETERDQDWTKFTEQTITATST